MDWLKGMNDIVEHIEANLQDVIDYESLSRMVGCSVYEFFRVFSFMTGVPVAEYIRRRRLSQAVFDIQNSGEKIIDIAYKYCYESPTSFAKAFKDLHGVTPSAARDNGMTLKTYPPISFKFTIKGVDEMEFRIEKRDSFTIAAHATHYAVEDMQDFTLPTMWLTKPKPEPTPVGTQETSEFVMDLPNGTAKGIVSADGMLTVTHIAYDGTITNSSADLKMNMFLADVLPDALPSKKEAKEFRRRAVIAAYQFSSQDGKVKVLVGTDENIETASPEKCEEIPAATWAVFSFTNVMNRDTTAEAYGRILTEWFPSSGYKRDETKPNLERFYAPTGEGIGSESHPWEIWVPVLVK
ncbi:MAG: AraC family transcriptional regulator [Defluviitaleaceae bacterium]|nr:AraC family transcriptional regulator [Defluviitaleaceae bacterium]